MNSRYLKSLMEITSYCLYEQMTNKQIFIAVTDLKDYDNQKTNINLAFRMELLLLVRF